MTSIKKACTDDTDLLSDLGSKTFLESHGHSASKTDIDQYIQLKFSAKAFLDELNNTDNLFHILFYKNQAIGYSKIILNASQANIAYKNVTKLERLYVLEAYQQLKLGLQLFDFNVTLSKNFKQSGMWLYTWVENHKAIRFYKKAGFKTIGSYNFKISDSHSNPNHQMLLTY